jgi:UDP-3-O-acyl-N-acetylglucosamine deacetylase
MSQSKSVNAVPALRNAVHTNNPRLLTVHDLRFRDVFVIHSRPTR